jgi:DNA-binding XRE family transcriptional regulator
MRRKIIIPRILKINWVEGLVTSVVFNNGESRTIDFGEVLQKTGVDENSQASILSNPDEFRKVELQNNTLSWSNVEQFITLRDGQKMKVPFEIGADVLFKYSQPEESESRKKIGQLIREARRESGLTQQQLALISGTTRNYISRIENDRSDIELATLWKIIETGLGKHLEIVIKPGVSSKGHRIAKKVWTRKVRHA